MSDGTFLAYIALLAVSGILLLIIGAVGFEQTVGARVLTALFGIGFLGYAFYLLFIFDGGSVTIFFYAFIVPILAIVNAVKGVKAKRQQQQALQSQFGPGQQFQQGQPGAFGAPVQPGGYPGAAQPGYPAPGQSGGYPAPGFPQPPAPNQPGQGYPPPTA